MQPRWLMRRALRRASAKPSLRRTGRGRRACARAARLGHVHLRRQLHVGLERREGARARGRAASAAASASAASRASSAAFASASASAASRASSTAFAAAQPGNEGGLTQRLELVRHE